MHFLSTVAVDRTSLPWSFNDGSHPVISLFVDFDSMYLALESGEPLAEFFSSQNQLDDRTIRTS
jgi:hypothetical protein